MPKISKIKDNIVTIKGSAKYKIDDRYQLSKNAVGVVLKATEDEANLLVVGDPSDVKVNVSVNQIKANEEVEVYKHYFGKIINPFGEVIHPNGFEVPKKPEKIGTSLRLNKSPSIIDRVKLSEPIDTGIIAIDTMIPVGKGQRELIIGDRSTGKTSIALSTIVNQRNSKVKCIYVAIGQKRNSVISVYNSLKTHDALKNTIVVFSNPDSSAEQLFAPTIGMAMAEALAYNGEEVLIVIDDLTKHANVCREISLSIGKNPGREAYPTDIFFQHSSLLERAGKFSKKYNNGSITCLPIVETVQGDLASLIPSNIISITDGQIFMNTEAYNKGLLPAIDIQLSVSRTGSSVQSRVIKEYSKGLKTEHATLSDVKKFADMSIDISDSLIEKIEKWDAMNNILVQYGFDGYTRQEIVLLIKLFRTGKLSKMSNPSLFSTLFRYVCRKDYAGRALINRVNDQDYDEELFEEQIIAIFEPLIEASNGIYGKLYSEGEVKKIKGESYA